MHNSDAKAASDAAKVRAVKDEIVTDTNRDMPGGRAALPPGTLEHTETKPHADEHRDQPVRDDGTLTTPLPGPRTTE